MENKNENKKCATHTIKNKELRKPGNTDSFAYRLYYALKLRRLLATELADKTGFSKSTLSLYTNGKSEPHRERVIILSNCLNVDPAWLSGFTPLHAFNKYDDNDPYLDRDLKKVLNIFNGLNKEGQKHLLDIANILFESNLFNK